MVNHIGLYSLVILFLLISCRSKKALTYTSTPELIYKGEIKDADDLQNLSRKLVYRNLKGVYEKLDYNDRGKIAFYVCINPKGMVTSAKIIEDETTMNGKKVQRVYFDTVQKYRWERDEKAPDEECGTLRFSR